MHGAAVGNAAGGHGGWPSAVPLVLGPAAWPLSLPRRTSKALRRGPLLRLCSDRKGGAMLWGEAGACASADTVSKGEPCGGGEEDDEEGEGPRNNSINTGGAAAVGGARGTGTVALLAADSSSSSSTRSPAADGSRGGCGAQRGGGKRSL